MDNSIELGISDLRRGLETDCYVDARFHPRANRPFYLHLADLREAIGVFKTSDQISVLDYGCGGSPYRSLFPNSEYIRADFTYCHGLDLALAGDSSVPAPDRSFDMVLSTQVLEHVPQPVHYMTECFRVLKPGGSLVLTTHGLYEEHGCPYDFQRWTADGLRLLLEGAGFRIKGLKKLTCGPRALCFFITEGIWQLHAPKWSLFGFVMWGLRWLWRLSPSWLNCCADRYFKQYSVVDMGVPNNKTYIALLAPAERPSD
jgi:SAM-dependent methyltransferase